MWVQRLVFKPGTARIRLFDLKKSAREAMTLPRRRGLRTGATEGWPSGLRRTLGKRVYVKAYRGFESHSLRHQLLFFPYLLGFSRGVAFDTPTNTPTRLTKNKKRTIFLALVRSRADAAIP